MISDNSSMPTMDEELQKNMVGELKLHSKVYIDGGINMKENRYDDNTFFEKYSQMNRSQQGYLVQENGKH